MNNIDELIEIIKQLNNKAYFDEIIKLFQIRHNMLLFSNHKKVILEQLQNNSTVFTYDSQTESWSLVENKYDNEVSLYSKAKTFSGGIAKFIGILDNYHIIYKLFSKEPSVRLSISTIHGNISVYDRNKTITIRADIPHNHPLSSNYKSIGGYLFNERNEDYQSKTYISVYFDEQSFEYLAHAIKKTQSDSTYKLSMEELDELLRNVDELDPNIHDGSYELVQNVIDEYSKIKDTSLIDVDDMDFIYSITIGTWKTSNIIRKERLRLSHLSPASKDVISKLIDKIWENACNNQYDNSIIIPKKPGYGMFGTGFMSFKGKLSNNDSRNFIKMMIDINKETDEVKIYQIVEDTLNDDSFVGKGMKTGSASVMLHCLNPFAFPIINGNDEHGTIYERLNIGIIKPRELKTYISNCRKIKKYRDRNFKFKNYRILDMSTWILDNADFNYKKFFHI